jgi:hypothetical protein
MADLHQMIPLLNIIRLDANLARYPRNKRAMREEHK